MGTLGIGIMNLTAFSLLPNSSPEVDKNQKMELTIESLSFYVGPSGLTCLSDLAKSDPSTNKTKIITKSGSSVGSSSVANSLVSPAVTENLQEKLKELDETQGEPDVEVTMDKLHDSSRDFASRSSDISKSIH
jgi:ABC-type phosphate/phosphonate transport system substrate-binding protein